MNESYRAGIVAFKPTWVHWSKYATPAQRFWGKVNPCGPVHPTLGTACWLWAAGRNSCGYGSFWSGEFIGGAHVFAWEQENGKVPDGLELDHLCSRRECVRPSHCEPITHAENVRRGRAGEHFAAKTHCPKMHPYSGANLRVNVNGRRVCRTCSNAASQAYKDRKRELSGK